MKPSLWFCAFLALVVLTPGSRSHSPIAAPAQWPREVAAKNAIVTVYQPQVDEMQGDVMTARAAFSVKSAKDKEPKFGALWFEARLQIDRSARTAVAQEVKVTRVRFPDMTPEQQKELTDLVAKSFVESPLSTSLDSLLTALEERKQEDRTAEQLKTDPPRIIVAKEPSVLVSMDGKPVLLAIEGSRLKRVANCPFLMVFDPAGNTYFLNAGAVWYSTSDVMSAWKVNSAVPADVKALVDEKALSESGAASDTKPEKVIISTEPSELIEFEGEPDYAPLQGNDLLYAKNTESDVFLDVSSQQTYVLLSGRWFKASSLNGPWAYVKPDAVPAAFKNIPPGSEKGEVRASVAGTQEAEEAVLDAQIPQTAAVKKGPADLKVQYDGAPQFENVQGTSMQYAKNTGQAVFKEGTRYYACENGVWYAASSPDGPWTVAETVPSEISKVPPSNPHYNTKYVYIYETTPTVVYVGYTPAYMGCYPWHGTVMYGTGWYYRPWIGPRYYYPYHATWGFGVHYNPWTGGWGYGFSYTAGGFGFSFGWGSGWYGGPWWGGRPPGWYGAGGYWHGYNNGYWNGYHNGFMNGYVRGRMDSQHWVRPTPYRNDRIHSKDAPLISNRRPPSDNLYARPGMKDRIAATPNRPATMPTARPSKLPNNVYADRDGNVFKKDGNQWNERDKGAWKPAQPANRPQSRPAPETRPARPQPGEIARPSTRDVPTLPGHGTLDREAAARSRDQYRRQESPRVTRPPAAPAGKPESRSSAGGGRRQ